MYENYYKRGGRMSIVKELFGKTHEGKEIYSFVIKNNNNMQVKIINYGATVVSIIVKDKDGNFDDVVLGYDSLERYEKGDKYYGAIVGRCANRIAGGQFEMNGKKYKLNLNNGSNHHHGGNIGFNKVVWNVEKIDGELNSIELSYESPDNEEGYPGNLKVSVKYTVTEDNSLKIEYTAVSDKDTVVNLTNHSYFNLAGHGSGRESALNHMVKINCSQFTVNDNNSIPTGEIRSVEGTPMDFRKFVRVGTNIDSDYEQIVLGNGYDHNWVIKDRKIDKPVAEVIEEKSGRKLEVFTTMPGMQFYSANFLDGTDIGKGNVSYEKRGALCFETQYAPNAINTPGFRSTLLKAGQKYEEKTIYKFSVI